MGIYIALSVLRLKSLDISAFSDLYFSTLRPLFPCVFGLLPPLYLRLAALAILGPIGGRRKRPAAQFTMLQGVALENFRFQSFLFLVLQQYMAEKLAADGIGNALGAGHFLASVKIEAIPVVVVAAQALDEP